MNSDEDKVELTPLEQAEKRWMIATEEVDGVIATQLDIIMFQSRRDPSGLSDSIEADKKAKIVAANQAIKDATDNVENLRRLYMNMKPYVPDVLKKNVKA